MIFFKIKRLLMRISYQIGKEFLNVDKKTLSVLCYHSFSKGKDRYSVDVSTFKKQVEKIAQTARFISLEEALSVLGGKKIKLPAVVLTIDDGYADVIAILPITKKYKIPVTIFVPANPEKVSRTELGTSKELLTYQKLKDLKKEGWEIGCHSATHQDFKKLSQSKLRKEILGAKKILERKLGCKIKYFAYPKGFYNARIINEVKNANYKAAFTIEAGCITPRSNKWILPRTIIDKSHKISEFPQVFSPTSFLIRKLTDRFKFWEIFLRYD